MYWKYTLCKLSWIRGQTDGRRDKQTDRQTDRHDRANRRVCNYKRASACSHAVYLKYSAWSQDKRRLFLETSLNDWSLDFFRCKQQNALYADPAPPPLTQKKKLNLFSDIVSYHSKYHLFSQPLYETVTIRHGHDQYSLHGVTFQNSAAQWQSH